MAVLLRGILLPGYHLDLGYPSLFCYIFMQVQYVDD